MKRKNKNGILKILTGGKKMKRENRILTFCALILAMLFVVSCTSPGTQNVTGQTVKEVTSDSGEKITETTEATSGDVAEATATNTPGPDGGTLVYSDGSGYMVNLAKVEDNVAEPGLEEETPTGAFKLEVKDLEDAEYSERIFRKDRGPGDPTYDMIYYPYKKVYVTAYNPTKEKVIFSSVKLVDNKGNRYPPSKNPDSLLNDPEFNYIDAVIPGFNVMGYLFFVDVDEDAKKFKLEFTFETGQEKRVFELVN